MTRYIDADALIEQAEELWADKTNVYRSLTREAEQFLASQELRGHAELFSLIREAPTADVAPVVYTRWVGVQNGRGCCSNCNRLDGVDPLATHCRYCGAKIDWEGAP